MIDKGVKEMIKQIYIENGLGVKSIAEMYTGEVKKSTIERWRKEEKWDELRFAKTDLPASLRDRLERLLERAISEAEQNVNAQTIFAISKLVAALRASSYFDFSDEKLKKENGKKKKFTKQELTELEKELGVL